MIVRCKKEDEKEIDNYISDFVYKSLYLYLDYKEYGLDSSKITMYKQIVNDEINGLLLIYGSTLHILSNGNPNYKEIANFMEEKSINMICGERKLLENIYECLNQDIFVSEYGYIKKLTKRIVNPNNINISKSKGKDFKIITDMLMRDHGFKEIYTKEKLLNQLIDLTNEGFTRSYVLKENGKIIAHAGTSAENDKIAILSYIIVDENYRRKGYATKIVNHLCSELQKDGKECYLVNYTEESTKLYEKIGFEVCCRYGKCYKKKIEGGI